MLRFIDLGKQIAVDETDPEYHRQFTFFNTITDTFINMDGDEVWDTWNDFEISFKGMLDISSMENKQLLERFKSLCHPWVFE